MSCLIPIVILDVAKDILTLLCAKIEYKHKMLSLAVKDNLLEVCPQCSHVSHVILCLIRASTS